MCLHTWHLNFCCGISLGGFILPQSKVSPSQEVTVTVTLHCTRKVLEGIPPQYFFKDIPLYRISGKTPSQVSLKLFPHSEIPPGITSHSISVGVFPHNISQNILPRTISLWKYSLTVSLKVIILFRSIPLESIFYLAVFSLEVFPHSISQSILFRSISLEVFPHSISESIFYLAVSLWKYSLTVSLWKYSLTVSLKVYFTSQYLSGSIPSQYLSGSITSQYLSKVFTSQYLSGSTPSQHTSATLQIFLHSAKFLFTVLFEKACLA